ncbi:hypothetical protein VTK73DRAFT_1520 [Phialemonium thermophilum]|uniref:Uncharacterized protein n=1 Tax=Phialemonium thermophilum TaxID=223376 RepID=A0ABR3X9U5_9PEZI
MSDGTHFPDLPLWSQMDFSANCSLWGNWLAAFLLPNPWRPSEMLGGSYPLGISLFAQSSPADFFDSSNMTSTELFGIISAWYSWNIFNHWVGSDTDGFWNWTSEFATNVIEAPIASCPEEYCKAVAYTGNADLTGIGVHVSYYVEAILATMYLVAFTIWHVKRHVQAKRNDGSAAAEALLAEEREAAVASGGKPPKLSLGQRILDSFRGSLDAFLTASMLISIVMLFAAIYTSIDRRKARSVSAAQQALPYFGSAVYDIILSLLAASFSVFPVMLIYALMGRRGGKARHNGAGNDQHRVWLRRVVLVVMWCLAAAEVYLGPRGELDYKERHDAHQEANYDFCNHRGGTRYWQAMKAAQVLVIGVPLLWLVLTAFVVTGFGIPGVADLPWVRRWRSVWRLGVAWLNMLLMWGLLAYFTVLRHRIIKTADGLDNEDRWTFGQILALATWVPVVVEFLYIFIWGIEESLGTHMPSGFVVMRSDSDMHLFSAATLGVDPLFKPDNQSPPVGSSESSGGSAGYAGGHKSAAATSSAVEMNPLQSPPPPPGYSGGSYGLHATTPSASPQVYVAGSAPPPPQAVADINLGATGWQAQPAWQHWNSTGW